MELAVSTNNGKNLTSKQKAWLESYLVSGNATQAARDSGSDERSARAIGYSMKQALKPCIQANLMKFIGSAAVDAMEVVFDIAINCAEPKVKLAAAQDILNRAGYIASKKVEISVSDKPDDELDKEITLLLKKGGIVEAEIVE